MLNVKPHNSVITYTMPSAVEIIIAGTVILILYYLLKKWTNRNDVPGPPQLPIIGNLLQWGTHPYKSVNKWSKKYVSSYIISLSRDIFQISMAGLKVVLLSDLKQLKEAFGNEAFYGRGYPETFMSINGGKFGIAATDGEHWVEQRRFTIRHLRDFGVGKKGMEPLITDEVAEMLDWMKTKAGTSCSIQERFTLAVLNSLWRLVAGQRYSHDDPKLNLLLKSSHEVLAETVVNPVMFLFPKLTKMFPNFIGWTNFLKKVNFLHQFHKDQIREHRQSFHDLNAEPRDLIDAYLTQMAKTDSKRSSFYKELGDKNLLAVLNDIFFAGSDTSATTLSWAVLYLTYLENGPQVAKKMQREIDTVVGRNRLPSLDDRPDMPYTESVIMEVLRTSPTVVLGLLHTITKDIEFHGYTLKKGTGVMANFFGIHNSKEIWGDPQNFRPERFIDATGKCMKNHEAMIAFSLGGRKCIGESLARDTLFLFLSSIYQKYNIVPDPDVTNIDFDPAPVFVFAPKKFTVKILERS